MSSLKEVQQIINQLGIDHLPEVRKVIRAVLLRSLIIHHHALSERAPPPLPLPLQGVTLMFKRVSLGFF